MQTVIIILLVLAALATLGVLARGLYASPAGPPLRNSRRR